MQITNIQIARVIAHEVVRATQLEDRPPVLSDSLIGLNDQGKELLAKRLVTTMASGSHCVDVTVSDATAGSPFDKATSMLDGDDQVFIQKSKVLANDLSSAQTTGSIKSGAAIFIQGSCEIDGDASRFVAIIKADSDQALYKEVRGEDSIVLTYVSDMLLGESQRLIKVALIIEEQEPIQEHERDQNYRRESGDFSIKIFDHMMQSSGNGSASVYFYSTFLKCTIAENAPRQTKKFYEVANSFIDSLPISQEEKVSFRGDLISHMRSNRATLEPRAFAQEVLPLDHQDSFVVKCHSEGITQAISKDTSLLKGKLRRQSLKFTSSVTLYAPPEVIRDSVQIIGDMIDGWTQLKIRGSVERS